MDFTYEIEARERGYNLICGIDEAGRGPLAGPVYAAAVILPENCKIDQINDSKKLTEKRREAVYEEIIQKAIAWGVGIADEKEIDEINILRATMKAMQRAVENMSQKPDFIFVDGNRAPEFEIPAKAIIKGDALCPSIAAASIIAKVSRDRLMYELDKQYPEYQFARHKGYGTRLHYEMIEKYGLSPVHRKTFLKSYEQK